MASYHISGDDGASVDHSFDLLVDEVSGLLGIVFEIVALLETHVSQFRAHAVLRNQHLCYLIGLLQVIVGSSRNSFEEMLLSASSTENEADPVD